MFYFTGTFVVIDKIIARFISSDKLCLKTWVKQGRSLHIVGKFRPFVPRKFCNRSTTWEVLIAKAASLNGFSS